MAINPQNQLIVCGTQEGKVEAWDSRTKTIVGTLDCAFNCAVANKHVETTAVTSLNFCGGLQMAVGTSTGQVLLYDIRSNKPFLVKDHMYGFPIKDVEFHAKQDYVYSMDKSVVKIWDKNNVSYIFIFFSEMDDLIMINYSRVNYLHQLKGNPTITIYVLYLVLV